VKKTSKLLFKFSQYFSCPTFHSNLNTAATCDWIPISFDWCVQSGCPRKTFMSKLCLFVTQKYMSDHLYVFRSVFMIFRYHNRGRKKQFKWHLIESLTSRFDDKIVYKRIHKLEKKTINSVIFVLLSINWWWRIGIPTESELITLDVEALTFK